MSNNELQTICIRCPIGCHLTVKRENGEIVVSGNNCPRGAEYGKQEFTNPMRTITAVYKLKNGGTICVRTNKAVEKVKYFEILREIHSAPEPKNPKYGDIFISNVYNTGADVIITEVNKDED